MERSVKIDWLNFTTRRSLPEVVQLFSYLQNPLVMEEKGLYGYNFRMASPDGVMVLFSAGRPDIHVQIAGKACDKDFGVLLDDLVLPSDFVTRLDIAIDCIGSGVTCSDIWGLLCRGSFLSVSSSIRQIEGLLSRGGQFNEINRSRSNPKQATRYNAGHTIYVGSSSSDRMVRIYDKGVESETGADWLRFEVQLRRESANQFFLEGIKKGDISTNALALLNRQIRLLEDGQDEKIKNNHHDRCKIHPFWAALTDKLAPFIMAIPKPLKTVRAALRYVKNASSTIKMLKGVMPDFNEFFEGLIEDARLKPHHVGMQDDIWGIGHSQSDEYHSYLLSCSV